MVSKELHIEATGTIVLVIKVRYNSMKNHPYISTENFDYLSMRVLISLEI